MAENRATVEADLKIESVEAAENAIEELHVFVGQFSNLKESSFKDLNALSAELIAERFEEADGIPPVVERVNTAFASLDAAATARASWLEGELANQKAINEALCKAFADVASAFSEFVKGKKAFVTAPSSEDKETYLAALQGHQADSAGAEEQLAAAKDAEAKMAEREIERNPLTNLTSNDLQSLWKNYHLLLSKKIALIQEQIEEAKRAGLSEEQIKEIDDNFNYFDSDNSSSLTFKELRTCLQSLGEESSKEIVNGIFEKYAEEKGVKTLTKSAFETYMKDRLGDTDTEAEIVRSFKHLSYDADAVTEEQLTTVVNNRTFNDGHVSYLTSEMNAGDFTTWSNQVYNR